MLPILPPRKSLVGSTVDALRGALEAGAFGGVLPGERKLCELLQVSRPTLRAALAKLAVEGWIQVAQGRASRVVHGRSGRTAGARVQLVVLSPLRATEMPVGFRLVLEELRGRLASVEIMMEVRVEPRAFSARPQSALESLVRGQPKSVWLLYLSSEVTQRFFVERSIPCVLAGTPVDGVPLPGVDLDHRATCRHAAATLINAGKRRLALLLPEGMRGGDEEGQAGFLEGVLRRGSALEPPRMVRHDATVQGVSQAVQRLLRLTPRPDGLLVGRAGHALTAFTHLLCAGIRVPRDIALIARDDDPFLAHTAPALARYAIRPGQFTGALAHAVEKLVGGVSLKGPVRLIMPHLIRGETIE